MTTTTRLVTNLAGFALLALGVAACGSSSTITSTPTTTQAAGSATKRQAGPGVIGKVVSVNGASFVVATSRGPLTVATNASTTLDQMAPATTSDLTVGQCVIAGGTANSIGTVDATTLTVATPGPSGCSAGSGRANRGKKRSLTSGGYAGSAGGGSTPAGGSLSGTFGKIAQVTPSAGGVTLEVQGPQGQVTINIGPATRILRRSTATLSAVSAGTCVAARGPAGPAGTVDARSVIVSQPGPSGCPTTRGRARTPTTS